MTQKAGWLYSGGLEEKAIWISACLYHHSRYNAVKGPGGGKEQSVTQQRSNGSVELEYNLLGLNGVPWDVEWVAHYIRERVVQFSEHLEINYKDSRYTK